MICPQHFQARATLLIRFHHILCNTKCETATGR
jgi:hypothetical protein